jgi:hypothetical protein
MHRSVTRLKDSAQKSQMQPEAPTKIEGHGGRSDIHDVARLACVSIATVSRVTSGVTNVDRKLARRVWKVIEELGYSPSRAAQALGSGRTRLIGLIVPEINNPFFCELIQGFEDIALEHGYEMMLGSTYSNPERALSWLQRMLQHGVHGIAMMTFATEPDDIYRIARGVPIVSIQSSIPREPHTSIQIDFLAGIRQALQVQTPETTRPCFAEMPSSLPCANSGWWSGRNACLSNTTPSRVVAKQHGESSISKIVQPHLFAPMISSPSA